MKNRTINTPGKDKKIIFRTESDIRIIEGNKYINLKEVISAIDYLQEELLKLQAIQNNIGVIPEASPDLAARVTRDLKDELIKFSFSLIIANQAFQITNLKGQVHGKEIRQAV